MRVVLRRNTHYFTYGCRIAATLLLVYLGFLVFSKPRSAHFDERLLRYQKLQAGNTECRVPRLDPWDKSIMSYYAKPAPLKCSPVQEQYATFDKGILKFDVSKAKGAKCTKRAFLHDEGVSDEKASMGEPTTFDFSSGSYEFAVDDEFFEVSCESAGFMRQTVYQYHFAQVVRKEETSDGARNYKIEDSSAGRPAVVVVGLDSMSRGNFVRQMPKTYTKMQKMGFVDMLGHVKIGDNTYANLVAALFGKRGVSTKEFNAEMIEEWDISFDQFDTVWKNFSRNGYATMFAEDRPDIGTFNYFGKLKGFLNKPVDHYFRPYWTTSFWSMVARRSTSFCYDTKPKHLIQLEYLQDFVRKYDGKRHFAFSWTQDMSHDYLNVIGKTDVDYERFFVDNAEYLKNSIVIVLSDHGHRYDTIRETVVGRLEARLPFLSMFIPERVQKVYPKLLETLKTNSEDRMTTQFDVNESFNAIAWGTLGDGGNVAEKKRAYSLFGDLPKQRSCFEAQIPEEFCSCFKETEIPTEEVRGAAEELLRDVNQLLLKAKSDEDMKDYVCAPLELDNIAFAAVRLPPPTFLDPNARGNMPLKTLNIQYRVVVTAKKPSGAMLEAVVVHNVEKDTWETTGEIERNNRYGNSSHCVAGRELKKICHCIRV